ncbi:MAG: hypothetical protein QOG79_1719 [Mycobacterium sp.]|nr:hypothetical protein [Mycobacterium sp.]
MNVASSIGMAPRAPGSTHARSWHRLLVRSGTPVLMAPWVIHSASNRDDKSTIVIVRRRSSLMRTHSAIVATAFQLLSG